MSKRRIVLCFATLFFGLGVMMGISETLVNAACIGPTSIPGSPSPRRGRLPSVVQIRDETQFFDTSKFSTPVDAMPAKTTSLETPERTSGSTVLSLILIAGGLTGVIFLISGLEFKSGLGIMAVKSTVFVLLLVLAHGAARIGKPTRVLEKSVYPVTSPKVQNRVTPDFSGSLEIGGQGVTQIGDTVIDTAGNLYVTGGFQNAVYFSTTPLPTRLKATQDYDFFVAKFNSDRKCLWARVANGSDSVARGLSLEGGLAIAVDTTGNCYVGGSFVSSLSFKNGAGNEVATLSDSGDGVNIEPFVAKYSVDGELIWAKGGNTGSPQENNSLKDTTGINQIVGIVVDQDGNPYVCAGSSGVNFLEKPVQRNTVKGVVIARLSPQTGIPVWISSVEGDKSINSYGFSIDDATNLYLVGNFASGSVTFPTQPNPTSFTNDENLGDHTFIAKYTRDGQCQFARRISGAVVGFDIEATGTGEFFVAGAYLTRAVFESLTLESQALGASGFLAKYTTDGKLLFVREFGKTDYCSANRVMVDAGGTVNIVGYLSGEALFGTEGPNPISFVSPKIGMFVATYNAAGVFQFAKQITSVNNLCNTIIGSNPDTPLFPLTMNVTRNPTTGQLLLAGDFSGKLALDSFITLDSDDQDFDGDGEDDSTDFDGDGDDDDGEDDDDGDGDGDGDGGEEGRQSSSDRNGFIGYITLPSVTVDPPVAELSFPKGGETFPTGSSLTITWTSSDKGGVVSHDLALSTDGGSTFATSLAVGLSGTTQSFEYRIPATLRTDAGRIRLTATNGALLTAQAVTPANFRITTQSTDQVKPVVTVAEPRAGATFVSSAGAQVPVSWTATDNVGVVEQNVKVSVTRNGSSFTDTVASGLPGNAVSFTVQLTTGDAVSGGQILVEAIDAAGNIGQGQSGTFTVVPMGADSVAPMVSSVTLSKTKIKRKKDPTVLISWQSSDNTAVTGHNLSFAVDGTAFSTTVVTGLPGSTQSFTWTVPATVPKTKTGKVKIMATDAAGNVGEAVSGTLLVK